MEHLTLKQRFQIQDKGKLTK